MYKKFYYGYYPEGELLEDKTLRNRMNSIQKKINGFFELFSRSEGQIFHNGLYRLHRLDEIPHWNELIGIGFPQFKGHVECFGCDWLGRQFAVDISPRRSPAIIMFEPGTGEAFEIPCNLIEFHNMELTDHANDCVAYDLFQQWIKINSNGLAENECVGYVKPLFLGGNDSLDNMEKSNLDIYWYLCVQLLDKTRDLPEGTRIDHFGFEEI